MRELTGRESLARFMRALGAAARDSARVYFTGGATAVLFGWREATIDIDVELVPSRLITPAGARRPQDRQRC